MNILFEESSAFKTASVLEELPSSYMAETASGRRLKIKKNQVFLTFNTPDAKQLLSLAEPLVETLDINFLWECAPDEDIDFQTFAKDYFGANCSIEESTALLIKLYSMPMYFCRRGKGVFRRAQEENLKAALVGMEKRRKTLETIEHLKQDLLDGQLPQEIREQVPQLLYRPDKNTIAYKAVEAACQEKKTNIVQLFYQLGAILSPYEYHLGRFLFEFFPQGTQFPETSLDTVSIESLPLAEVEAFSIDDESTVEIDDALSVTWLDEETFRVGIHIAAPSLFFRPESDIDQLARKRLSTVYMPGDRIIMLPETVVEASTLAAGQLCPTLSYYATFKINNDDSFEIVDGETRLEKIRVSQNLVTTTVEAELDQMIEQQTLESQWRLHAIALLYKVALMLQAKRLANAPNAGANKDRIDFSFYIKEGKISIVERRRGSPLDTLISEMMIFVNSRWAAWLKASEVTGIYRTQTSGKVKMSTVPAEHSVLGVDCYGWSSSPLRRYVDLVNQWQLTALVQNQQPPFRLDDERLYHIIQSFDLAYIAYNEFQTLIERYWCLRWLEQEEIKTTTAVVLKDQLIRVSELPLTIKSKSLPTGLTGQTIEISIESIDFWELSVHVRHIPADVNA